MTKSQFLALYEGSAMDWNRDARHHAVHRRRGCESRSSFPPAGCNFRCAPIAAANIPIRSASCHGYSTPVGVPIILQLGAPTEGDDVKVSSSSLNDDGAPVDTCAFDATSYANPDGYQQIASVAGLHSYGAVVMIPKNPLQPGHTTPSTSSPIRSPTPGRFRSHPTRSNPAALGAGFTTRARVRAD